MEQEKRGPGRPRTVGVFEDKDVSMEQNNVKAAPAASRGLREAALRTEQLRKNLRVNDPEQTLHDDFYIDPAKIPDGWSYEWKRKVVAGLLDPAYEVELAQEGWEPVDASRHPEMMPIGYQGAIERKGMILMERPLEITEMFRQRAIAEAREAVEIRERAIGQSNAGQFETDRKTIRKEYSPVMIPKS
jgi:hypothetical protein